VARSPDAIAVVFEQHSLSYASSTRVRANGAAPARARGRPEVVVGLCLERSLEMIVALLGILKAGGVYLPLDPDYPPDGLPTCCGCRRRGAGHAGGAARAPGAHDARIVCLDTDWPASPACPPPHRRAACIRKHRLHHHTSELLRNPKGLHLGIRGW